MKIAIVGEVNNPIVENSKAGTEVWTYDLAESLVSRGLRVDLFAREGSKFSGNVIPVCSDSDFTHSGNNVLRYKTALSIVDQMMKVSANISKYDLLHISIFSFYYGLPLMHLTKKPIVATVHGYCKFSFEDIKPIFEKYDDIHYIFPSCAFLDKWPKPKKYSVIKHGIDLKVFSYNKFNQGDYFFWIGRLSQDKGVEDALSFAESTGTKLKIAGKVEEEYFVSKIKPRLSKNIEYVGELDQNQKIQYYQNAKAVLFTSKIDEAFGLVVLESIACGTPVVSYSVSPINEIIKDGESGVITRSNDVKGLIDASKRVNQLERSLCRKSAEKLSSDKMVNEYVMLYNMLLNKNYKDSIIRHY